MRNEFRIYNWAGSKDSIYDIIGRPKEIKACVVAGPMEVPPVVRTRLERWQRVCERKHDIASAIRTGKSIIGLRD
jgi:hypothetical protein